MLVAGVAYILKLLDQYYEFDSLHWFQAVRQKFRTDRVTLLSICVCVCVWCVCVCVCVCVYGCVCVCERKRE